MNDERKEIVQSYVSAYNNFDVSGMTRDLHEAIVFENRSNGEVNLRTEGIVEFSKQAETAKHYFRQRQQTIQAWEFTDSTVSVSIGYEAILNVDFPNGLKMGDVLKLEGKATFEFVGMKISKIIDES